MRRHSSGHRRVLAVAAFAFFLAACGDGAAPTATPDAATTAVAPGNVPDDYALDAPIAREDVAADLALVSPPVYVPELDVVRFHVDVTNTGAAALTGDGTKGVNLGLLHVGRDDEGAAQVRTLGRSPLPLLRSGDRQTVVLDAKVEPLLGLPVHLELFQHDVAWFGRTYGQPVVETGSFQRCADAAGTLCDATGKALAVE